MEPAVRPSSRFRERAVPHPAVRAGLRGKDGGGREQRAAYPEETPGAS